MSGAACRTVVLQVVAEAVATEGLELPTTETKYGHSDN
jgi:hypothetical protein